MKLLTCTVAAVLCLAASTTQATQQIPDHADAAMWAALNGCKLRMSMGSSLSGRLAGEEFHPFENGMRWSSPEGDTVDAALNANATVCKVTAKGPSFPRAGIEAWMGAWAARSFTPDTTGQTTVWHSPTSVMVFTFKDGGMEVLFT